MTIKYIGYFRVSTPRQGQSGLGLEAQQNAVRAMAERNQAAVIAEYIEVETGKSATRPKLLEAVRHAKLTNATLVVAKLDRLSRNAWFTRTLKESRLKFVCCDNEHANALTIDILAVMAEHEALAIAARTKVALKVAKDRGTKLGSDCPGHWDGMVNGKDITRRQARREGLAKGHSKGVAGNAKAAETYYCDTLVPEFKRRREMGESLETIVAWLNENHFLTRFEKSFTVSTVWRIIKRYLGNEYLGKVGAA